MASLDDLYKALANGGSAAPLDQDVSDSFPLLWGFLYRPNPVGWLPRVLPELVITVESGGYKVTLKDHETGYQCTLPLGRLCQLVEEVETGLASGRYPWSAFKSYRNPTGLKRHDHKK